MDLNGKFHSFGCFLHFSLCVQDDVIDWMGCVCVCARVCVCVCWSHWPFLPSIRLPLIHYFLLRAFSFLFRFSLFIDFDSGKLPSSLPSPSSVHRPQRLKNKVQTQRAPQKCQYWSIEKLISYFKVCKRASYPTPRRRHEGEKAKLRLRRFIYYFITWDKASAASLSLALFFEL